MNLEDQVGRRLAELRQQQGYRQEDFLELLHAQGVEWTQATLSRVEGGKRPIRLTEAFAISEALGIDPKDLGPDRTGIGYRVESLKPQFNRLKENAAEAIKKRDAMRDGIAALRLADALRKDRKATFVANGTASRFINLVSTWIKPTSESEQWRVPSRYTDALTLLGIEESFEPTPEEQADYRQNFDAWLVKVLHDRFPNLTFVETGARRFSVPGLTESLDVPGPLPLMGADGLAVHLGIDPATHLGIDPNGW